MNMASHISILIKILISIFEQVALLYYINMYILKYLDFVNFVIK